MKTINISRFVILLALAATVFTSCKFEEEDLFENSAYLRQEYTNREIKNVLCRASENDGHGWVLQYFVAGTDDAKYPGYNIFCQFYESGKVVMGSDHPYMMGGKQGVYMEYPSFYEINKNEANTLAFTTWNNILTPFVNPDSEGEGMHGDCDLIVMNWNEKEINFRGTRHSARSRLLRLDCPIEEYLDGVNEMKKLMNGTVKTFYVINGTDTTYVKGFGTGRPTYIERLIDPLDQTTISCVFTPTGYRTERADSIMGESIQEFIMNEEKSALVAEGCEVKVVPMWDTYLLDRTDIWSIDETTLTAQQKDLLSQLSEEIKKYNTAWSIKSIGLGKTTGGNSKVGLVFNFYTNAQKSKTNTAGIELNFSRPEYGKQTIAMDEVPAIDKNMEAIIKKATNFVEIGKQLASTIVGTYTVVPDNYFAPTGGTYTSADGTKTFTLAK